MPILMHVLRGSIRSLKEGILSVLIDDDVIIILDH